MHSVLLIIILSTILNIPKRRKEWKSSRSSSSTNFFFPSLFLQVFVFFARARRDSIIARLYILIRRPFRLWTLRHDGHDVKPHGGHRPVVRNLQRRQRQRWKRITQTQACCCIGLILICIDRRECDVPLALRSGVFKRRKGESERYVDSVSNSEK